MSGRVSAKLFEAARRITTAKGGRFELLLVRQAFVHRQENVELPGRGDEPEQLAVFDARPAGARHGLDFVAGQFAAQTRVNAFIQQNSHLRGDQHFFAGLFEKSDGLFAGDSGETLQKIVQRSPPSM